MNCNLFGINNFKKSYYYFSFWFSSVNEYSMCLEQSRAHSRCSGKVYLMKCMNEQLKHLSIPWVSSPWPLKTRLHINTRDFSRTQMYLCCYTTCIPLTDSPTPHQQAEQTWLCHRATVLHLQPTVSPLFTLTRVKFPMVSSPPFRPPYALADCVLLKGCTYLYHRT